MEERLFFLEVDTDQHRSARCSEQACAMKKTPRVIDRKIADGRPGKVGDAPSRAQPLNIGKRKGTRIVGTHGRDIEPGKTRGESFRECVELRSGDIDGHVGDWLEMLDQFDRFSPGAAAVLDQYAIPPEQRR